ncbi:MAG: cobalt-precorrin 5A hydrolase, partial [Halarsenatibacteraceae bacterium]
MEKEKLLVSRKNLAVITLTKGGIQIGSLLKSRLKNLDLYIPEKFNNLQIECNYYCSLKSLIADKFKEYDALVFIMALGIVIRLTKDYLVDKRTDPAIITIDEQGENVISTVSGHLGGANQISQELADIIKANPVITTGTDSQGKLAVDLLASKLNASLEPFKLLTKANAALVNNRKLNIYTDYNIKISSWGQADFYLLDRLSYSDFYSGFDLIISNQKYSLKENQLQIIPRNIVIGIGTRKGISLKEIEKSISRIFAELNLHKKSIKKLATIDLKAEETGIIEYTKKHELDLEIISRKEIKKIEDDLNIKKSDFVNQTIGVSAAASPAAILASDKGDLLLDKIRLGRITV